MINEAIKPRALDLCCCAGGASMGLHRAGFDVAGVDIRPQPRYPFNFFRADARTFDLSGYDVYWLSPPCQIDCQVTPANRKHLYENLIPALRERVAATGKPYIIENVAGMKKHLVNPVMLCGQMFGLKVFRHRYFESNLNLIAPKHEKHDGATGTHRWPYKPINGYVQVTGQGSNFTLESGRRAMGIPWMIKRELAEAIPPAYSEYLGRQVMRACFEKAA